MKTDGKSGRSGHFIKKKAKEQKITANESHRIAEQEHDEMLKVAKVIICTKKKTLIFIMNLIETTTVRTW